MVTQQTAPEDWVVRDTELVQINGSPSPVGDLGKVLAETRQGVVDVELTNSGRSHSFQFEFALAEQEDLDGVDRALEHLVEGGELSITAIDGFIMRGRSYPSAARYLNGIASYLYGVLAREKAADASTGSDSPAAGYEGKYDQAVSILSAFARPPAEAICGLVAFHYNQFGRAMMNSQSPRVAGASLRLETILAGNPPPLTSATTQGSASLDVALSDTVIDQVLRWCSLPLDGSAVAQVDELVRSVTDQRPYDALKLHVVAAEHFLAAGVHDRAAHQAEAVRHSRLTETWYGQFRNRLAVQSSKGDDVA